MQHPGAGHVFFAYRGSDIITKYIYIGDDYFKGAEENLNTNATVHGKTVNKREIVLCAVVGF